MPAKTPPAVVEKLNALLIAGTKSPAAKAFFGASGTEPFTTTPDALVKFQQVETQKWGQGHQGRWHRGRVGRLLFAADLKPIVWNSV